MVNEATDLVVDKCIGIKTGYRRYLVITELFRPTNGGTAVWFDQVYRRLGKENVHIVTAYIPGSNQFDEGHPNSVTRISLKRYWWLRPESMAVYLKMLAKGLVIAFRNHVDVIHAGRVLPEGLVGLLIAKFVRAPILIYAHGEEITTWTTKNKRRILRWVYRNANMVIANSDFTRGLLLELDVKESNIALINPGVNLDCFRKGLPVDDLRQSIGMEPGEKLLLSVGRLSRRKGFDSVIEMLPTLIKEGINVRYVIVGIGDDLDYLKCIADKLGVSEKVFFAGRVSMQDLPRWYNLADLFIMPNREIDGDTEGFGMVFVEAAACGTPSIAGKAGGTGDAVLDGTTGLRIDASDQEQLLEATVSLLKDTVCMKKMSEAAYQRAQEEFSWDHVARKTRLLDDKLTGVSGVL